MRPVCVIITITAGGDIVALSTDRTISANAIFIEPWITNGNGPFYVGNSSLAADGSAGVIHAIPGATDSFTMPQGQGGSNQLSPSDYRLTSPNSGDKFYVTWWIA